MSEKRLRRICNGFRARLRVMLLQYGAMHLTFFVLFAAGVLMVADWYFRFSPDSRLLSLLTVLGVAGACYYFDFHRPLRRSWTDDEVLGYMDRTAVEGQDTLTTLRDLSNPEGMREWDTEEGKEMVRGVVSDLESEVDKVKVGRAFHVTPVRRWRKFALIVLGIYAFTWFVPYDSQSKSSYLWIGIRRMLLPWSPIYWPQKTRILVAEPEAGWRVPKGEPFLVTAKIDGEVPPIVNIVYQSSSSSIEITERMAVNPEQQEAVFTFGEMIEPVDFYCIGGDDYEKRMYRITVAERPMLTGIAAHYKFPKYTMLPNKTTNSGQLTGLEGTDVDLEFTSSTKLEKANITFELGSNNPEVVEITEFSGYKFTHSLRLSDSGVYTVELTDREGLKNGKVERYEIRVEPDNPPEVTLVEPARDMIMTARGKVRCTFKAKDDYNLTKLEALLAPEGAEGMPLSDRITGPFWTTTTTLHPVGDGDFDLDFLKEKDRGSLKNWKIEKGVELEFWIRAVDCNPNRPGITESIKVRLSILHPTDFMDEVVLKAKNLMNDARTGWFAEAGAYHDGKKFIAAPNTDDDMNNVLDQQETAERSAMALGIRFPEILEHMARNRMQDVFMSKRLDDVATKINGLKDLLPEIGKKIAEGRPKNAEEAKPASARQKMANALRTIQGPQNKAAWQMRLLYNRLADWVALQSVLLKTRRMEELQAEVNQATDSFVKRTLGREARELEEEEVREMKEVSNQQGTVHEMDEAVEKELAELILQADRDGRKKVWEALAKAFHDLRENRVQHKLKRASMAILDARGDVVRGDQKLILRTLATVNRGLIKAGEEVPEDPASMLAAAIDDPRGKEDVVEKIDEGAEAIEADAYDTLERLEILKEAKKDTLDDTLNTVFIQQEDIRNRTMHVAEKLDKLPRYLTLRTGLTAHRQGSIVGLLEKGVKQAEKYGEPGEKKEGEEPAVPDPAMERIRGNIVKQVGDYLGYAHTAMDLIEKNGNFDQFVTGTQTHIYTGARELRVYAQETNRLHKLSLDRKATNFLDPFERKFLLNEKNFEAMVDAGKTIEWILVQQAAAQREADLLAKSQMVKKPTEEAKKATESLLNNAVARNQQLAALTAKIQEDVSSGIVDPAEEGRENEHVKPQLQDKVLGPLSSKQFKDALDDLNKKNYQQLALKQEAIRRNISAVLVSLKDMFEARVPPKAAVDHLAGFKAGEVVSGPGGFIEYRDEQPGVLADIISEDAAWIDVKVGDPKVRKMLIESLRGMDKFDPRYARLQSAYFQAIAQNFQAKAKKDTDKKEE